MSFIRFIAAAAVLGFAGSALAIDGASATGVVSVTELVSQLGTNQFQYSYTIDNIGATNGLGFVGVYSDFLSGNISQATYTINGSSYTSGISDVSGNYSDANNTPGGFSSVIYGYSNGSASLGVGQSATLSFIMQGVGSDPSNNPGEKLFFAQNYGTSQTPDADGANFSFIGYTPTPSPEPKLMILLGVAGLGIAVARRRTA